MLRRLAPGVRRHFRSIVLFLVAVFIASGADAVVIRLATKNDLHDHGLLYPLAAPPVDTPILLTDLGIQVFSLPQVVGEGTALSIQFIEDYLEYQFVEGSEAEGLLPDLAAVAQTQQGIINVQAHLLPAVDDMTWWWHQLMFHSPMMPVVTVDPSTGQLLEDDNSTLQAVTGSPLTLVSDEIGEIIQQEPVVEVPQATPPDVSQSENSLHDSIAAVVAATHEMAAPQQVCGQRPDMGWGPGLRKYCDSFYKGMKKLAVNLGKWLPGKGRKKIKTPALPKSLRPRGSSQSSPVISTGCTLLAIAVAGAASLLGYWYMSSATESERQRDTESDDSEPLPSEPETEDSQLYDPVDCTGVRNALLRSYCQKLSVREEHVAARLVRYFDLNRWRMEHFYVSAAFKVTVKGRLMLEPLDSEERVSVLFGAVGYPARRSTGHTGRPIFHIDSKAYTKLILKAAKKLARLSPEILTTSLAGRFDPVAQVLFWCGIPMGKPAGRLHHSCTDWLMKQLEIWGAGWYEEGGHGLYYRLLTEPYELEPGQRYLGYLPRFYLKDIETISGLWYEPRILAISQAGRSLNIPTVNTPESVQALCLEGLPETFDILSPTKGNRWYALREKVRRWGGEFISHNRRLAYAIRASGERHPERFFTFSGEELLESPLGREQPATGFGQYWQSPGAGYLNAAVYNLPWQLYLH
ncbi:MAG: hypothetical protein ACR2PT_19680 [Endozoicomonas sp.]